MPAAPAIAPLPPAIAPSLGTIAVKTTSAPAVPAPEGGFGQVLRSVWGPATGVAPVPASNNAEQGLPAPVDPDQAAAAIEESTAGQVATAALVAPNKGVTTHTNSPVTKPEHSGRAEHNAAEPDATTPGPAVVPAPQTLATPPVATPPVATPPVATPPLVATPAVVPSQADDSPPATTLPSATSVSLNGDPAAPVRATLATTRLDAGGTAVQGAVRTRAANGPVPRAKPDQGAASTPVAETPDPAAAEQAAVVQARLHPVDAPAPATTSTEPAHPAAVDPGATGRDAAIQDAATQDGVAANAERPSIPSRQISVSGEPAAPIPNTPLQPVSSGVADAAGQPAVPATPPPRPPLPPVAATDAAGPAAPAADRKITLRPVETGTDPAKPTVPSGSGTEQLAPAITPAAVPATATVAAPHQAQPTSPVEQLAPALLTLTKTADGGQQMTVRLHPADLGMVQVRIAQMASGMTQIDITADNPATLLALQRDQPQLHRTLDDAGMAAAGRTVTFHVAQPAQAAAGGNGSGSPAGNGGGQQGSAGRSGTGTTDADGSGGGQGSYPARERTTFLTGRRSGAQPAIAGATAATAGKSYRIGLDITA